MTDKPSTTPPLSKENGADKIFENSYTPPTNKLPPPPPQPKKEK